ncbi:MAG: alpha/beta hydrolase-fold protein [Gammaproteobacteria bacterium]
MNPAIRKLLGKETPTPSDIDAFLDETTFPLVDGTNVTFAFRGDVEAVYLRCWISGLDTAQPFQKLEGTDLWATTIELPKGSRIEYKLEIVTNGHGDLILDPLNSVLARDPFGANSVCQGYGYKRPEWTLHDPSSKEGSLHHRQMHSKAFNSSRDIQVYLPATYRDNRRYPLLIVHDGIDYLRYADMKLVLDNLIHRLEIPPVIVALVQSPDRLNEYCGNDTHAQFLVDDLLPLMSADYPLLDDVRSRCLMGASFGGVASLHAAYRYPEHFGSLLLQSGSFAFSDLGRHKRGPVFDPVVKFMNEFRENPQRPADRVYMSCGVYESLIYENRSLVPHLQSKGVDVRFEEARDAHNWENWRDRLRIGLTWLMPGPAWLVYE